MERLMRSFVLLLCFFGAVCASDGQNIAHTDFSERTINFVIFLAILWYIGADRLRSILRDRQRAISVRFEQAQERRNEAKRNREQAQKQLEDAQKQADDIIATAKKESVAIMQKYENQCSADIENLVRSSELLMLFEQRRVRIELVDSVLKELFTGKVAEIESHEYVRILREKVS